MWDEAEVDDGALLRAAREGDREAYAELFRRHRGAAVRFGTRLTGDVSTAHDLVSEAFVKLMRQLDLGLGPESRPLSYVMSTMRNLYVDEYRRHGRREIPTADALETEAQSVIDDTDRLVEGALVAKAFGSLSENARKVLWLTEVLGRPLSEVAETLGSNSNAVAVQAFRAREALREAYLLEHAGTLSDPVCQQMLPLIPKYVRGQLSGRKRDRLEEHLETCTSCPAAVHNVRRINTHLAGVVLPALALGAVSLMPERSADAVGAATSGGAAAADPATPFGWRWFIVLGAVLLVAAGAGFALVSSEPDQPPRVREESPSPVPTPTAVTTSPSPSSAAPASTPTATAAPTRVAPTPRTTPSPPPPVPRVPSPRPIATPTVAPPSMTPPYVTVTRSSGAASALVSTRMSGLTSRSIVRVEATNVDGADLSQLGAWRCTQVQSSPTALRLTCVPQTSGTALFTVGLPVRDVDAPVTGTIGFSDGSQVLSFVVTP